MRKKNSVIAPRIKLAIIGIKKDGITKYSWQKIAVAIGIENESPIIEKLPRSINLWRCLSHWLGGMGIVALTVALMPVLGVGGFQLIKAETTGPEKGKFTPKITTTAKILWFIYLGMTLIQTALLKIAGMDFIDALCHAFSTLGTGGFSTRNASIGAYNSAAIEWICFVFMFLAGINFSLYYYFFTRNFSEIKCNSELKA